MQTSGWSYSYIGQHSRGIESRTGTQTLIFITVYKQQQVKLTLSHVGQQAENTLLGQILLTQHDYNRHQPLLINYV